MPGPYRKVERITVHNHHHLTTVLRLAGLLALSHSASAIQNAVDQVGSFHGDRFSVYRDIESVYTVYYTPGD